MAKYLQYTYEDCGPKGWVPKEYCYQEAMMSLLHTFCGNEYDIHCQANEKGNTSCDIIIQAKNGNDSYALELVAHARNGPADRSGTVEAVKTTNLKVEKPGLSTLPPAH
jgi:hypothetical protein